MRGYAHVLSCMSMQAFGIAYVSRVFTTITAAQHAYRGDSSMLHAPRQAVLHDNSGQGCSRRMRRTSRWVACGGGSLAPWEAGVAQHLAHRSCGIVCTCVHNNSIMIRCSVSMNMMWWSKHDCAVLLAPSVCTIKCDNTTLLSSYLCCHTFTLKLLMSSFCLEALVPAFVVLAGSEIWSMRL